MSTTSRWILFITEDNQQKLVLLHRIKDGDDYYVFPWGHIEDNETPEETLIREMREELNVEVTVDQLLYEGDNPNDHTHHYFYLCKYLWWKIQPGDWPERDKNPAENFYEIVKIPVNGLADYNLLPTKIKELVIMHSKSPTTTLSQPTSQIDFFENVEQTRTLHLTDQANLTYALFLKNAKIKLTVIAESPEVQGQIFAFIPPSTTSLNVEAKLHSSRSAIKVHLIAIQQENAEVKMQGTIDIAPWVEKASGQLLEEVILLWNAKYTSLQPILNVASPDVQASHGAKVHRVPLEKLFYMQSRGLTSEFALQMIVNAYVEQVLGHFEVSEEERNQIYSFIK